MPRLRTLLVGLALAAPTFTSVLAAPVPACAGETGPRGALVVDTGPRVLRLCVALDAASVSGIHLIELAGRQHGLQHSFGFGGQAVCSLAGVGVDGGDCFGEYPEYWGYWRGDGRGGWTWASSGAGSATVGDGDVDGWVWGTGDSGATHGRPPRTRIDTVCATPEPDPEPSSEPSPTNGGANGSNGGGPAEPSPADRPADGKERKDPDRPESSPSEAPGDADLRAASGGSLAASSSGPPPALYLALVAAGALVVGGRIRLRRRGS